MKSETDGIELSALREVGSYSLDSVVIIDRPQGVIIYSNQPASDLLELNSGDSSEKFDGLIESVVAPDQEYVKNKFAQLLEDNTVGNVEFRIRRLSGETVWLNSDAFLLGNGKFLYVVVEDVTRKKQHDDYLVEYGAKKNTLLDTLTHQLNGSLMLMNNLALNAVKLKVGSNQKALDEFVSLIHNSSKTCIDIINDLLVKEHAESPGIHVKFARVDVVRVVNYIFEELRKMSSDRTLLLETTAQSIFAHTDDIKLLQIVNNLASNALKFTRDKDTIRISVFEQPESVLITVEDTGIGIPEGLKPFLFEKHGPARRTGLNGERSIGLGLPICNHLTQLVGGKLWFESEEGVGTKFFVELAKE